MHNNSVLARVKSEVMLQILCRKKQPRDGISPVSPRSNPPTNKTSQAKNWVKRVGVIAIKVARLTR